MVQRWEGQGHFVPGTPGKQRKILVHQVLWRALNYYAWIPKGMEISHRDTDTSVLSLLCESHPLNESRKACHSYHPFGWQCEHGRLLGNNYGCTHNLTAL
jgi:hypothetical protein